MYKKALSKSAIVALVATLLLAVAAYAFFRRDGATDSTIPYRDYRIPVDQLRVVDPHPGCEQTHYHAGEKSRVTATDGTVIADKDMDCGFGPVR